MGPTQPVKRRRRGPVDPQLNTQARRRVLAHIRATEPNCHLCGYPINLGLDRQRHPLASCGDEVIPRKHGGSATDPANVRHSHRICNGVRATHPPTPEIKRRCRDAVERIYAGQSTQNAW